MEVSAMKTDEVVEEIMRIHKGLPTRPGIDEVEAAKTLIKNVEREDETRLEAICKQRKHKNVPHELFNVLQEMQKNMVYFQSNDQKREASKLLDLENFHVLFDDLIQKASNCLSNPCSKPSPVSVPGVGYSSSISMSNSNDNVSNYSYSNVSSSRDSNSLSMTASPALVDTGFSRPVAATTMTARSGFFGDKGAAVKASELVSKDDSFLKKAKTGFHVDGNQAGLQSSDALKAPHIVDPSLKPAAATGGEKLSLIKLASLIEVSEKKGSRELNLQSKLMDQVEWLPDSIGKISSLTTLDLSENRIIVLPVTIGSLSSLQKLDLHGNRIPELPESVGDIFSLVYLDLSGNQLQSLPPTVARLVRLQELNLSSNNLLALPDTIGSLVSLKKLFVETNDLEEIPHTIGQCSSLKELRADYNRLKALPEAVGRIAPLEVLSVRYNNIRQLPTTMASMASLKELDVSFNELESVPESLCFATTLIKMNISNNFADLKALPRSIGNLDNLEELNMSNNQIRILPDSFRMLSRLRILNVEGNPLEVPPSNVIEMGAQAVVQYIDDLVAKRDIKSQPIKQKKSWAQICFFSRANKRKRNGNDYVNSSFDLAGKKVDVPKESFGSQIWLQSYSSRTVRSYLRSILNSFHPHVLFHLYYYIVHL